MKKLIGTLCLGMTLLALGGGFSRNAYAVDCQSCKQTCGNLARFSAEASQTCFKKCDEGPCKT